jgi:hypothetical protein
MPLILHLWTPRWTQGVKCSWARSRMLSSVLPVIAALRALRASMRSNHEPGTAPHRLPLSNGNRFAKTYGLSPLFALEVVVA